jgi:hypothetical protein
MVNPQEDAMAKKARKRSAWGRDVADVAMECATHLRAGPCAHAKWNVIDSIIGLVS